MKRFFLIKLLLFTLICPLRAMDQEKAPVSEALAHKMKELSLSKQPVLRILPAHGRYKKVIMDLNEVDPITQESFEDLSKAAEKKGLYYLLAEVGIDNKGDEQAVYFDAYSLNRYIWDGKFLTLGEQLPSPLGKKDPLKRTIMGPVHYFALQKLSDKSFDYIGSDYNQCSDNDKKVFMRRFFIANYQLGFFGEDESHQENQEIQTTAWNNLGVIYLDRKELALAKFWFLKAVEFEKNIGSWSFACLNLGKVLIAQNEQDEARKWFLKVTDCKDLGEYSSTKIKASNEIAGMYHDAQDFANAKQWFLKALELTPDSQPESKASLMHDLCLVADEMDDNQEAVEWGNKSATLWSDLGLKFAKDGKYADAKRCFIRARSQSKMNTLTWGSCTYHLGLSCSKMGDYDDAKKYYAELIKAKDNVHPEDYTQACISTGYIYSIQNNFVDAEQMELQALEGEASVDDRILIYDNLKIICEKLGKPEEAQKWASLSIALSIGQSISVPE